MEIVKLMSYKKERKDNKFYYNMERYDQNIESIKKEFNKNLQLMLGYLELIFYQNQMSIIIFKLNIFKI